MKKRVLIALGACLAAVLVAAGCGGGGDSTTGGDAGDSTSSSGPAPTKAAFIKEADGICRKADTELTEEIEGYAKENGIPLGKEPSEDQQIEIVEAVVLPNLGRQGEEIGELTPPEGDEDTVGEIVDALDEGVSEAESNPDALIEEGENPLEEASSKATAYGLKVCGAEG